MSTSRRAYDQKRLRRERQQRIARREAAAMLDGSAAASLDAAQDRPGCGIHVSDADWLRRSRGLSALGFKAISSAIFVNAQMSCADGRTSTPCLAQPSHRPATADGSRRSSRILSPVALERPASRDEGGAVW